MVTRAVSTVPWAVVFSIRQEKAKGECLVAGENMDLCIYIWEFLKRACFLYFRRRGTFDTYTYTSMDWRLLLNDDTHQTIIHHWMWKTKKLCYLRFETLGPLNFGAYFFTRIPRIHVSRIYKFSKGCPICGIPESSSPRKHLVMPRSFGC